MNRLLLIPVWVLMVAACSGGKAPVHSDSTANSDSIPVEKTTNAGNVTKVIEKKAESIAGQPKEFINKPTTVVEVICRSNWGAKKPVRPYEKHEIKLLTVHHSGVFFDDPQKVLGRLKIMQSYHQGSKKKFADIAYHFVIGPGGKIYQGRPTSAPGETRTDYDPSTHLLICLLGDFEKQEVNELQLAALTKLLAWATTEFRVSTETIEGHRDHARTDCPGMNLHAKIKDGYIKNRVEKLLMAGHVDLKLICGD